MGNKLTPARAVPPGRILGEELRERGWTAVEFAGMCGLRGNVIWQIIEGDAAITESVAAAMAKVLGTSAALWMNLEREYRDHIGKYGG